MQFHLWRRRSPSHRSSPSRRSRGRNFELLERRYAMDGSLALTEVMYNPPEPASGTFMADDFEFVELKNISAAPIQLGGMQLVESTTPGSAFGISYTFGQHLLQPGNYIVVAKNVAAFQSKYGTGINVVGPFGGALGNGGERLVMQDTQGGTIFDFEYDDGWKPSTDGDGKSLVLLDPLVAASQYGEAGSWDASVSIGGSPARDETGVVINEVLSHTDNLFGDWIELHNTSAQAVNIGGWFLSDDVDEPNKFRIPAGTVVPAGGYTTFTQVAQFDNPAHPGTLTPFGLSELGEEVVLTQADAAGNLGAYQVVTDFGAFDREVTFGRHVMSTGETAFPPLASPTFGAANSTPRVEAVVINELMFEPAAGGDEFIEIRNLFQIPVPLHDPARPANVWRFDSGVTFDFPAGTVLPASGYALVTQIDPAQFRAKYSIPASVEIFGPYTGSLNNSGEEVSLVRPGEPEQDGTIPYYVADVVDYLPSIPWPTGADGTGATLSRSNPLGYGEDPVNWATGPIGGTPGAENVSTPPLTTVVGTAAADTIHVVRAGSQIHVYVNTQPVGQPTYSSELGALGETVTIQGLGGDDMLFVNTNGQPELGIDQLVYEAGAGVNTLRLEGGAARIESTAAGGTLNTTVQAGAHLSTTRLTQGGMTLADNSKVTLLPGGETSVVTSLSLGSNATLDITDNALVVNYSGASPVATVRERILAGRGGPGFGATWTGVGIHSSTAAQANMADPEGRSIGYAENALLPLGAYANFRGVAVDETAVLIAYTRTGDANLDGAVNDDDVTIVGATYSPGMSQGQWALGDFDYSGFVDDDDVTLLGVFYQPALASPPPPPANYEERIAKDEMRVFRPLQLAFNSHDVEESLGEGNRRRAVRAHYFASSSP